MANDLSSSTSRLIIHGQTLLTATYLLLRLHRKCSFLQSNLSLLHVMSMDWSRFWDHFRTSINEDASLFPSKRNVFLRGYLAGEAKMLVGEITVTANTYEETKRILLERYGDMNRIIQAHL